MMKQVHRMRSWPPILLTLGSVTTTTQQLSWTIPAFYGASPITGYNVYFRVSGGTRAWTLFGNTASTSETVTGLTSGASYEYMVRAVNVYGESTPSNVAGQPTQSSGGVTVPSPPLSLVVSANEGAFDFEWLPPASDGGSAVTDYNVYISDVFYGSFGESLSTSISWEECPPGTQIYVTAVNAIGESTNSIVVNTQNIPSAPQNLTLTLDGNDIVAEWEAPGSDGGTAILDYNLYLDGVIYGPVGDPELLHYSFDQSVCPDGTEAQVSAINIIGEGPLSLPAIADIPFEPPQLSDIQVDLDPGIPANVLLNGGLVAGVTDVSHPGIRDAYQSNSSLRGTVRSAELNGWDVVYMATGKHLNVPSTAIITWDTANAGTMYLVVKYRASGSYVILVDSTNRQLSLFVESTTGYLKYSQIGGGNAGTSSLNQFVQNQWLIISLVTPANGNNNTDVYVNGTYIGNKIHGGPNYTDVVQLGSNPSGSGTVPDADYARFILANTAHDTTTRQKMEGWLAHRFGLTGSLPGDHPYKSTPP